MALSTALPTGPTIDLSKVLKDSKAIIPPPRTKPVTSADAQKALYIPPAGVPFRLCGLGSKKVLYSSKTSADFGHVSATEKVASSHWFKLVYGTDKKKDMYEMKSVETSRFLSISSTSSSPSMLDSEGTEGETWHKFEAGIGDFDGYFRVLTQSSKKVLSATDTTLRVKAADLGDPASDQYFTFLFDPSAFKFETIEWDLKKSIITHSQPLTLGCQTLENDTNYDQEMSFEISQTVTGEFCFMYTYGMALFAGFTFKAEIPVVSGGGVELSASSSSTQEFSVGTSVQQSVSYTQKFPVKTGPKDTVFAKAVVTRGIVDVPYTIKLSLKEDPKIVTVSSGVWRGQQCWDLKQSISSLKDAGDEAKDARKVKASATTKTTTTAAPAKTTKKN